MPKRTYAKAFITDDAAAARAYLVEHGIQAPPDATAANLQVLVACDQLRLKKQRERAEGINSFGTSRTITVCALNRIIAKYDEDLMTDKTAVDVKFMIVDWADPDSFIEMRHNLTCRSIVQNGMCPKCAVPCEGVPSWRIGLVIKEVGSGDATLEFFGWEGVAKCIFAGKSLGDISSMTADDVETELLAWSHVPLMVTVMSTRNTRAPRSTCSRSKR